MNSLDFLVLIFSLALGVRGFRKGVIREGSEIVIAVISVLVAAKYEYMVAERLGWFVGLSLPIARAMSFFAIAVTWTAIGFFAISWWHKK